nr:MAG TPA: hypothetical protein [Caudoviricetes sp.]
MLIKISTSKSLAMNMVIGIMMVPRLTFLAVFPLIIEFFIKPNRR